MSELLAVRRRELRAEIEDFYYTEAQLLDERRFGEWLDLLAEDLVYFMPLRRNVRYGQQAASENTRFGRDISWFDEDKWTLQKRVEQIQTGIHWAEEPLSRVRHLITNVQIAGVDDSAGTIAVRSNFIVYQNRVDTESALFVGGRTDELRRAGDSWQVAKREIILDQSVLLAKNLTVFF